MTSLSRQLISFLLAILLLAGAASGQSGKTFSQASSTERQLISIKVKGSKRYPEKVIAEASGLQLGSTVTEDDFKRAARRLGDTGAFTDIGYSFSFSSAGTKLDFQVTDATQFVPVRFEDFVWFSDEEMLQRIKEHAPLFNGELPLSGKLAEEVSDVLQAMLVEHSIPGHVQYVPGSSKGPIDSIIYQVENVVIQIRNIEFSGAGESELGALKAASQRLADREYSRTLLSTLVQKQLLPVYYARGYLKAAFGDPQPKVIKQPSEASDETIRNLTIVDVTLPVVPGQQYKLKALEWSGNHEMPTDTLQKMVRAELGKPANTVRIGDNLRDVQKLYGSKGYVTASITPNAEFDEAAGTVVIRLDVKEGFEYHMGELDFRGLDNSLTAKLRNAWKIRTGEVYDTTYLSEYLPAARKLLPANLDWDVASHVTANVKDKTVDVDLVYTVKAPK